MFVLVCVEGVTGVRLSVWWWWGRGKRWEGRQAMGGVDLRRLDETVVQIDRWRRADNVSSGG